MGRKILTFSYDDGVKQDIRLIELFNNTPEDQIFYIWGHAYEFDIRDEWARFEEFLSMMTGKKKI